MMREGLQCGWGVEYTFSPGIRSNSSENAADLFLACVGVSGEGAHPCFCGNGDQ